MSWFYVCTECTGCRCFEYISGTSGRSKITSASVLQIIIELNTCIMVLVPLEMPSCELHYKDIPQTFRTPLSTLWSQDEHWQPGRFLQPICPTVSHVLTLERLALVTDQKNCYRCLQVTSQHLVNDHHCLRTQTQVVSL